MKASTLITVMVGLLLAYTSMSSFAQQGQRGGATADRVQQVDRDRIADRDRTFDRDRTRDRDHDQDQDRDQDRIHDPANLRDQDIYGSKFMTPAESAQYRKALGEANTKKLRMEIQAEHEKRMQERALQQGQDLVPPGQGPVYGGEFMSVQERNEYREQLRLVETDQERQQFQAQHRDRIDQRAKALGLKVEEAE